MQEEELKQYLPSLTDPYLFEEVLKKGRLMEYKAGEVLIEPGQYIKMVPIILKGLVKVLRTDTQGRELFLYYLEPGQTCAVSLTCCSSLKKSEIKAVAEEDTRVWGIPFLYHEEWHHEYRQWKEFVAQTYQSRFQELLMAMDEIAFKKMDERLLTYITTKARQLKSNELSITHQAIATDLGTSREVVSRLLKQLEHARLIELGRNKIYVRDGLDTYLQNNKLA